MKNVTSISHKKNYIHKTNLFTKFHDDRIINETSRVFTSFFYYINIRKLPPPPSSPVIQLSGTIFELNSHIKKTNVLTKFHENWAKNVTSRGFTCFHYIHIEKNAPPTGCHISIKPMKTALPTGGHVFQRTGTTFELNQHIIKTNILTNFELDRDFIGTNLLTKFHEDWTKTVASRVFTNKCGRTDS
ncbi:hypothetical protein DPMN_137954 [Dreissena polymorpha]|uniref:Uncharacterized protein n=1 Tax=Dreissena polymorpha TaxID=45954 RepID=A0A9D4G3E6_DREPO|nr:hypothetical protein DPMN_137954 [Dreissena polymorpha]